MRRPPLSAIAAVLLTAGFLALAFKNVDAGQLAEALRRSHKGWVLLLTLFPLADLLIRAAKWRILLQRSDPLWVFFRLETIGMAVNNVLFLRLGEVLRAVLAGRELGIPVATALASVVVERAVDTAALLAIFSIAASSLPGVVSPEVRTAGWAVLAAALGGLAVVVYFQGRLRSGGSWEERLRSWGRVHRIVTDLADGAQALRSPARAMKAAVLNVLLWLTDAFGFWVTGRALGLGDLIDFPRAVLVLCWAAAGAALPAAPGALGTFEAMVKSIVVHMGAAAHLAFAYAVLIHMVTYAVVTTLGLVLLYGLGLSLRGLADLAERR